MAYKMMNLVPLVDMRKESFGTSLPKVTLPPPPPSFGKEIVSSSKQTHSKSPIKKVSRPHSKERRSPSFQLGERGGASASGPSFMRTDFQFPSKFIDVRSFASEIGRVPPLSTINFSGHCKFRRSSSAM